jgi:NAD(P)H-dependent FMN reductase
MNSLNILIISSSLAEESCSRLMMQYCASHPVFASDSRVNFFDLAEAEGLLNYPRSLTHPLAVRLKAAFEDADAILIGCGIYMWRPCASVFSALEYGMNGDCPRRHQPVLLLSAAGSTRAHLAADNLAISICHEIGAMLIAPPIVGAGADVDVKQGTLAPALRLRIDRTLEVLVHHARAAQTLWRRQASAPLPVNA